jgi:DNA-binding NtrC family response regulator
LVSRVHAAIKRDQGEHGLVLTDLRSFNGTFLNGQWIVQEKIRPSDIIRLGDTVFLLLLDEEDATAWLPPAEAGMVGQSAKLRAVIEQAAQVGPSDICALITGESGVGKDLLARYLHSSSRRRGPFVPVNCASLRPALACSELFGHLKGAFSGADSPHEGLFQAAAGGTIFLDEIGELPLDVQAQLLRVLENHEIRPVGALRSLPLRARIVAATNVNLETAIREGGFRADLYARLAQWTLVIPPLRERREDVLPLWQHFINVYAPDKTYQLHADFVERLCAYGWPLNIRELLTGVRQCLLKHPQGALLQGADVPLPAATTAPTSSKPLAEVAPMRPLLTDEAGKRPSRSLLEMLLTRYQGSITAMALELDCHRVQVHRWLKRYGLDAASYRQTKPNPQRASVVHALPAHGK